MPTKVNRKVVTSCNIIAACGFAICLSGCIPGIPVDLATHGAQPHPEKTPQVFLDYCAEDAGAFVYRRVSDQDGYLQMPVLLISLDGTERPYSGYSSFRPEFSNNPSDRLFNAPLPMSWSPSNDGLRYYEGYNPPFQNLKPVGTSGQRRLPDQNSYFEGYVRKEMVRRPSLLCEENDRVNPRARQRSTTHCIYYGRSDRPHSEFARQRVVTVVAHVPIASSTAHTTIERDTYKIFSIRTGEILAETKSYRHSFRYTATAFWKGELTSRSSVHLATCRSAVTDNGRGRTPDNWSDVSVENVLGIARN